MKAFKKLLVTFVLAIAALTAGAQDEVIRLYDGPAPGSEDWDWEEGIFGDMITGVAKPTLTVYRPENPNGVAMVVCPGGAFCFICFDREGDWISRVYNSWGITCFVLKYRVYHDDDQDRMVSDLMAGKMDSVSTNVIPMALEDAANAVRYVRTHAADYGIDPDKIGLSGSSAGGTITMGTAMKYTDDDCRPNFAVVTYPYLSPHIMREGPTKPLPLFIATATDDAIISVSSSLEFYRFWLEKGQKTEMHLFQKGNHGFIGHDLNLAVEHWTDNLLLWFRDTYPDNFK